MTKPKATALAELEVQARAAHLKASDAEGAMNRRDALILEARRAEPPAGYDEIAQAAGITRHRVSQIIQRDRRERSA